MNLQPLLKVTYSSKQYNKPLSNQTTQLFLYNSTQLFDVRESALYFRSYF